MAYSAGLIHAAEETKARTVYRHPDGHEDGDSPAYRCLAYTEMLDDVILMEDVAGGTKAMRSKGEEYLPRHPMERQEKYPNRVKIAIAFNALQRTISGLVGMVFRRDPVIVEEKPDSAIVEHLKNIDQRGRDIGLFGRAVGEKTLRDGHSWIHVEAPDLGPDVKNRQQDREAGRRPYWISVGKRQAINWRYEVRDGKPVLTLFVYLENSSEPVGQFGERVVERIRVLREVGGVIDGVEHVQIQTELWELKEAEGDKKQPEWELVEGPDVLDIGRIPVVFVPAKPSDRAGEFRSDPPLRDLAYEQVEHYRVRSDRQRSLTFSAIAVPYAFGKEVTDETGQAKVGWGPDGMMLVNDPEAKAGIIESHGHGLSAMKDELDDIDGRMARLGLQMLAGTPSPRATTATERLLDKNEDDASLVLFAQSIETALNEALALHAEWRSLETPVTLKLNRDFHVQLMDPKLIEVLSELVAAGRLSTETLWMLLVQGEVLDEEFEAKAEWERIQQETEERMASDPILREMRRQFGADDDEEDEAGEVAA